jgi:hypothetical protein
VIKSSSQLDEKGVNPPQESNLSTPKEIQKEEKTPIESHPLPKQVTVAASVATVPVDDYVEFACKQARTDLISNVSDNMPEPFDMKRIDKRVILSLPMNIKDHDRLLFRQLIALANDLHVEIVGTTQQVICAKESQSEKDFFYGFFKLLSREPLEREKFGFSNDSASAKGAAQAKLVIMQRALGASYSDVQHFLPQFLFTDKGTKRLELELNAIASGAKANITKLQSLIPRLVGIWLESKVGQIWADLARNYKVPVPMILEGLHRTKVVKEKGKDIVLIKKPKRPSKRIEVLSVEEARILESLEKPFTQYKEFIRNLDKEIAIKDIKAARDSISKLIQAMWLVVEKVSAPLTKRRTALVAHMSESERKKVTINKAFIQSHVNNNFADCKMDKAVLYTISPIPLLLKCGFPEDVSSASKCEVNLHYVVIPEQSTTTVQEVMWSFSKLCNIECVNTRPIAQRKRRGPTKVDEFDDADIQPAGRGSGGKDD